MVSVVTFSICVAAHRPQHEHPGGPQGALLLVGAALDHPAPPHQARGGRLPLHAEAARVPGGRRRSVSLSSSVSLVRLPLCLCVFLSLFVSVSLCVSLSLGLCVSLCLSLSLGVCVCVCVCVSLSLCVSFLSLCVFFICVSFLSLCVFFICVSFLSLCVFFISVCLSLSLCATFVSVSVSLCVCVFVALSVSLFVSLCVSLLLCLCLSLSPPSDGHCLHGLVRPVTWLLPLFSLRQTSQTHPCCRRR